MEENELPPSCFRTFTPYLLTLATERQSHDFSEHYKDIYGLLRTEKRALYHLGQQPQMISTQIARGAKVHKSKISRAVRSLERRRFLTRTTSSQDRRFEHLALPTPGKAALANISRCAASFEGALTRRLGANKHAC